MTHAQDNHASTDDSDSSNRSPRDHKQPAPAETTTDTHADSPQSANPEERVACLTLVRRSVRDWIDRTIAVFVRFVGPLTLPLTIVGIAVPPSPADHLAFDSTLLIGEAISIFACISSITFSVAKWRGELLFLLYAFANAIALILVFARLDWALSVRDHGCFTEALSSRTDALYFAVTNLSSGGPGNISPVTALCKQLITIQGSLGYILTTGLLAVAVSVLIDRMTARRP